MKRTTLKRAIIILLSLSFLYGCTPRDGSEQTDAVKNNKPKESSDLVIETNKPNDKTEEPDCNETIDKEESTLDKSREEVALEVPDDQMVKVRDYIPDIEVDLKYASANNFTGVVLYDFTEPELRYGTVKKLKAVSDALRSQGYKIEIWDAFRPLDVQWKLWEIYPDPVYVANPGVGISDHTQGHTIDLTLVTLEGEKINMPSDFDEFSTIADRDYSELSSEQRDNAIILETAMYNAGFEGYEGEWWHYSDTDYYPVIE